VGRPVAQGLTGRVDNVGRRVEIWLADLQVHDLLPLGLQGLGPPDRVLEEGVAPVDEDVALLEQGRELRDHLETPYRVIINEAIELTKSYGGTDGHKFVNGVLDKLAPELRPEETAAK